MGLPLAATALLAILSLLALAYAVLHDANTRRRVQQRASTTSRPEVQQRPGRDDQSVLDHPWWA